MLTDRDDTWLIVGAALQELIEDAEAVLRIAGTLSDQVARGKTGSTPQQFREMAALGKSTALALVVAAASVVGSTERLSIVARFAEDGDGARSVRS